MTWIRDYGVAGRHSAAEFYQNDNADKILFFETTDDEDVCAV